MVTGHRVLSSKARKQEGTDAMKKAVSVLILARW